jgi:hypothetical protein
MEHRYGYTAGEALGQRSHDLLRSHHWLTLDEIAEILADRSEWHGGIILHRADGQPVMVGNYWRLHADPAGTGSFVTEVHTDIVASDSPASSELADVMATIAQDLSQPATAATGFIGGVRLSVQQARLNRDLLDRGLADAAAQLARTGDIIRRVRALGASPHCPRFQELHQRLSSTVERTESLVRESGRLRQQAAKAREQQAAPQSDSGEMERAILLQNIQVYRRRLAAHQSDEHTDRLIRQLLAEEEAKLATLQPRAESQWR